jgi:hypothetical protein
LFPDGAPVATPRSGIANNSSKNNSKPIADVMDLSCRISRMNVPCFIFYFDIKMFQAPFLIQRL